MKKQIFGIYLILFGFLGFAQECPDLVAPTNGATNVPVDTTIDWEDVTGVNAYIISLGTTPGGGEIVSNAAAGSISSYTPPLGLPENTLVFVTITLFFFDQDDITCPSQSFRTEDVIDVPECTTLISPQDGDTNVNVATNLQWLYAARALGYRLSLGTTPGGTEILNNADLGNTLIYNPPADFPANTEIFVRITPYNENGEAIGCSEVSFTTGDVAPPPNCTTLISPVDGATNVPLSPLIEWLPVAGATGYRVFIGRSPTENDVLDGAVFFTTSTFVLNFEANSTYFVRIIPFNAAGDAIGCGQESFSTILGCGPFFNDMGELITLNPVIDFPEELIFCENELPATITSSDLDVADGFRWYRLDPDDNEFLLSEDPSVVIDRAGRYRYEAYTINDQDGVVIECPTSQIFTVTLIESSAISDIQIVRNGFLFDVTIIMDGNNVYEFALDDSNGPYQPGNTFFGLEEGTYTVFVRDNGGCGLLQETFVLRLPDAGFPKFFTPNGDNTNEFWQYRPPRTGGLNIATIYIFDRFGKLLKQLDPQSQGWDGRFLNQDLPSSDYWYKAITEDNAVITGHFSLIR